MPHLRVETNIPQSKIPADLTKKLVQVVSGTLSQAVPKPIHFCVATVIGGVNMYWGGNDANEPIAQASLTSIGALGTELNKKHSKAISDIIEKELGIRKDRMYIHFIDATPSIIGYQGTTFDEILIE